VNTSRTLLALALSAALLSLAACDKGKAPAATAGTPAGSYASEPPPDETADQFIARVNAELEAAYREQTAAAWLAATYINADSELVSSKSNERALAQLARYIEQAKKYDGQQMSPETARAFQLLKLNVTVPPPRDPQHLARLTELGTKLEGMYGAGKYCTDPKDDATCRDIGQLSDVLADPDATYEQKLEAWTGWHTISVPMRKDYQEFVELSNEGARELGFANTGELWRGGYDMPAADFQAETDRLWGQVKPLYEQLQCYAKNKLVDKYGAKGEVNGMLPAHLTGNLWQQDWGNLYPLLAPYPNEGSDLDITGALQAQRNAIFDELLKKEGGVGAITPERRVEIGRDADLEQAKRMAKLAEGFYTGLGMPKLPDTFYTDSQLLQPRDRDVVCHASAWPMDLRGNVRIKMCIKPDEDSLTTLYHELGHDYYYLAYKDKPALFQTGANDGFHEAIGDTIVLSMTPEYLHSIGLVGTPSVSQEAVLNSQMRMALAKVAFLPFGLMIDRWRWGVFDGSIAPGEYNKAWWDLKAKYQGVAPVTPRGEEFFDAGAKYHVPGNTPYTRYFLSHILQFQFYKSLCDASGYKGPLYQCSFANNPEAGKRYWAMLQKGASQPWPQTLRELTGGEKMDAGAVLEYFAPLQAYLTEQNKGKQCGWEPAAAAAPAKNG
jgi:peptidyl-dipeptidase A